jgi:hypothetical protein
MQLSAYSSKIRYSASLDAHIVSAVQDAARIQQLNVNWRVIKYEQKIDYPAGIIG